MASVTTLPSKELEALRQRFKPGYSVTPTRGGHFEVLDPQGDKVRREDGRALTLSSTPSDNNAAKSAERELRAAGVLRGPGRPPKPVVEASEAAEARRRGHAKMVEARTKQRNAEAKALHDRLEAVIGSIGGFERPGNQSDLSFMAAMLARENGSSGMTPDLLSSSIQRVAHSQWVEPNYQSVWNTLAERLEQAEMPKGYFALLRQARNIPEPETLTPTQLDLPSGEWPFVVQLVELDKFFLDHAYQRPPYWPFIRKIAAGFDETLVGAIDVSDRGGRFAIMDGQLRFEAMRLVGKKTCWASVYNGLDQQAEARFFLRKNNDRKAIHTFYTWKAQVLAGDEVAIAIDKLTKKYGYRIWMTSAATKHDDRNISAIDACRYAYTRVSEARKECLSPTLETLKASTFGREQGQSAQLIRGLGRFFWEQPELDMELLATVIAERGARWITGKGREEAHGSGSAQTNAIARVIRDEYNRYAPRGEKLR